MPLTTKQKKDFTLKIKDPREHGENIVFIKGGSVILEDQWVFFPDLRIDVQQVVQDYVSQTSRRLFNGFNGILYVLVALNKATQVEVIPSISYNKNSFGDVKVFQSLSGKLPLVLVRLTQDGSPDLKAFKRLTRSDFEVYQGHGNFTTSGVKGDEGYKGITGLVGITGLDGITGNVGELGAQGFTGLPGAVVQGITGAQGLDGVSINTLIIDRGVSTFRYVFVLEQMDEEWDAYLEGDDRTIVVDNF
jgi:hypothetical protein